MDAKKVIFYPSKERIINFYLFKYVLKGMEYLIENNLVENTTDAVSSFLFNGEGLNKTSIGSYLGEK